MNQQLIKKIENSKVYDVAIVTPLDHAKVISARLANNIYLKREDLQSVFSFKLRGAYNKIAHLSAAERKQGVIAASAGNHAGPRRSCPKQQELPLALPVRHSPSD